MDNPEEAISRVLQEHVDAVNTCDVELLLRGMTDDVVYLGPSMEPILGKAAMRAYITPLYAKASIQLEATPVSIEIEDSRAIEWGLIKGTMASNSETDPEPVDNKYLFIYRLDSDGEWRICYDVYNTNQ